MLKKGLILCLIPMLCLSAAAETYIGKTVATRTHTVTTETAGTVTDVLTTVGQDISEGEDIALISVEKVFAQSDGVVADCLYGTGESASGTAIKVAPVERYTVYCTVDGAYRSPETMLVHSGETVYAKCTANGTHKAVGRVTLISGSEYRVEIAGGELFIGETVYLYRDEACSKTQRIGIGTVVATDPVEYGVEGTIVEMCVTEGECVERGELLFTYVKDKNGCPTASVGGIVSSISVRQGEAVGNGQVIAEIVAPEDIVIEFSVPEDEITGITKGRTVYIVYADDRTETVETGYVSAVSHITEDGSYSVRIRPDTIHPVLGLEAEIMLVNTEN